MPDETTFEQLRLPPISSLRSSRYLKTLTLTDMSLVSINLDGTEHLYMDPKDALKHLKWMFPPSLEIFTHLVWNGLIFNNDEHTLSMLRSRWSVIWSCTTPDMFPNLKVVMVQEYGLNGSETERKVIWKRENDVKFSEQDG